MHPKTDVSFLTGGGLFAYSSQAVGNVMTPGTGSYTNMSVPAAASAASQEMHSGHRSHSVKTAENASGVPAGYHRL